MPPLLDFFFRYLARFVPRVPCCLIVLVLAPLTLLYLFNTHYWARVVRPSVIALVFLLQCPCSGFAPGFCVLIRKYLRPQFPHTLCTTAVLSRLRLRH